MSGLTRADRHSWIVSLDVTTAPSGVPVIGYLRSGQLVYAADGSERPRESRDVYLAIQGKQPRLAGFIAADDEVTIIDLALLNGMAATVPGQAREPVRFTGDQPVSAQAAESWKAAYAYVRGSVLARPDDVQPMVIASAARVLAATTLATFPNNTQADPASEGERDTYSDTLCRAVAFIDEHCDQDVTAADIARHASVTTRAVQLAFQRHLQTTPMAYLRRVRLGHAHQDLQNADPAITVTAVAYRWGFPSPGRFARYYQQVYGVRPSRVLRRH